MRLKPWPPSPNFAWSCWRTSPVMRSAVVGESPKWTTVASARGLCASRPASEAIEVVEGAGVIDEERAGGLLGALAFVGELALVGLAGCVKLRVFAGVGNIRLGGLGWVLVRGLVAFELGQPGYFGEVVPVESGRHGGGCKAVPEQECDGYGEDREGGLHGEAGGPGGSRAWARTCCTRRGLRPFRPGPGGRAPR